MALKATDKLKRGVSLGWIVPICLLLISMGMRVPFAGAPRSPKPRPRAIVETSSKSSQDATAKKTIEPMEPGETADALQCNNEFVAEPSPRPGCTYSSAIPAPTGARAPPLPSC